MFSAPGSMPVHTSMPGQQYAQPTQAYPQQPAQYPQPQQQAYHTASPSAYSQQAKLHAPVQQYQQAHPVLQSHAMVPPAIRAVQGMQPVAQGGSPGHVTLGNQASVSTAPQQAMRVPVSGSTAGPPGSASMAQASIQQWQQMQKQQQPAQQGVLHAGQQSGAVAQKPSSQQQTVGTAARAQYGLAQPNAILPGTAGGSVAGTRTIFRQSFGCLSLCPSVFFFFFSCLFPGLFYYILFFGGGGESKRHQGF